VRYPLRRTLLAARLCAVCRQPVAVGRGNYLPDLELIVHQARCGDVVAALRREGRRRRRAGQVLQRLWWRPVGVPTGGA
jgi:hypothetical protein